MLVKALGSILSLLLVAGAMIGMVGLIERSNHKDDDKKIASTSKSVTTLCAPTDYKEACEKSLSHVNDTDDPKEYIKAAILATVEAATKTFNLSNDLIVQANNSGPEIKMALGDCNDLLESAVAELQASFSSVGDGQMRTMDQRTAELQNWLSAVISYQETCLDQLGEKGHNFSSAMKDGMLDASQLTSNALAIIGSLSAILKSFGLQLNVPKGHHSRKLLSLDDDGYPNWLPAAKRRILAAHESGVLEPNATVALDSSEQYMSISAALAACPPQNQYPFVIYVKAGKYKEQVTVNKNMFNVFIYGDGPSKTIITGDHSNKTGYKIIHSATFAVLGDGFVAKSLAFENSAGPEGNQAVALRVQADKSVFFNCRIDGYQNTLYVQTHRQFYKNCTISGTIDFIFGDASAVIQESKIVVRRPMDNQQNTVTAQTRAIKHETTGLVLHSCKIVADEKLAPDQDKIRSYLGRPLKAYSRVIIMASEIGEFIHPEGWLPYQGDSYLDTLYFGEYGNKGLGAKTEKRVRWKGFSKRSSKKNLLKYTAESFLQLTHWFNETTLEKF